MSAYDPQNIFARILRGEIPCKKAYEDEHVLAFHDIAPKAPVHVLVIPKAAHVSLDDFAQNASPAQQAAFWRAIPRIAADLGLTQNGYRVLSNHGRDSGQEVPHFHVHLLGGKPLGPLVAW